MKKILLAFGDSHTAGSEIEEQWQPTCYEKAYPSHIAKHYGFDYLNFSQPGGSNQWILKKFSEVVPRLISKNIPLFIVCNFCESSRMFFIDKNNNTHHLVCGNLDKPNPDLVKFSHPRHIQKEYKHYLKNNPDKLLSIKSLLIIQKIQNFCMTNNIPFLFHVSSQWYWGDWSNINKKNFYGHHDSEITLYTLHDIGKYEKIYSYWGRCDYSGFNKLFEPLNRWKYHFPEVYHVYWANLLIDFIDNQKILEGYI